MRLPYPITSRANERRQSAIHIDFERAAESIARLRANQWNSFWPAMKSVGRVLEAGEKGAGTVGKRLGGNC